MSRGRDSIVEKTFGECPLGDGLIHASLPDIGSLPGVPGVLPGVLLGALQFLRVVLLHLLLQTH